MIDTKQTATLFSRFKIVIAVTLIIMSINLPIYLLGAIELTTYLLIGWSGAGGAFIGLSGVQPDKSHKEMLITIGATVVPPVVYILTKFYI